MKKLLIASLLFSTTTIYGADNFIVKDIQFEGLHQVTIDSALIDLPVHIGEIITNNDIKRIINSLFASGLFDDIKILRDSGTLIIRVKESPIISHINLYGNKLIKRKQLQKKINYSGLRVNEPLNRNILFKFKQELDDFYHSVGHYNTRIKIITAPLPNNHIKLNLVFQESVPTKIQQINISGNKIFSNNQLLSHFDLYDASSWRYILGGCFFNKNKLLHDLNFLQDFYINRGYANFNINSVQMHLTPDKKRIFLSINLNEGEQYKISNIIINGNINKYAANIKPLIIFSLGKLYNGSQIARIEQRIKNVLDESGYIHPTLTTNIETNNTDKSIKIYINVDPGYHYHIRKIYFEGNDISQEKILRRELRQMEYSLLEKRLISQGKDRLKRTGYFESVDVIFRPVLGKPDQLDLIYLVKERNVGSINFGVGYGSENGLSFHSSMIDSNWFGKGKYIKIEIIKDVVQTYGDFSINHPYFTINGINLGGRIFYNYFKPNHYLLSNYTNNSYGINGSLGFPLTETGLASFGLEYEHHHFHDMHAQIAMWSYFDSIDIHRDFKKHNSFYVNDYNLAYSWKSNNLDRGFFPNRGHDITFSGKISIPISRNNFYKNNLDIHDYIPLNKQETWILSAHGIISYGNGFQGKELPFYENFYAGGIDAIRGFKNNTIGPKAVYLQKKSSYNSCHFCQSNDTIGGNCKFIGSLELIMPTPFLSETYNNSMRTSIFLDAGSVWNTKWKHTKEIMFSNISDFSNPNQIRISAGITIQWISPFGPMIFSYSQPLKKYDKDKVEQFQFNVGKLL